MDQWGSNLRSIVQNRAVNYPQWFIIFSSAILELIQIIDVLLKSQHKCCCFSFVQDFENVYKLLVIVVVPNAKQTNWLHNQYYVKTPQCFYQKLSIFFPHCSKNWKLCGIQIWEILENHLLENVYMQHIITTSSSNFKHPKIFYDFQLIKQTFCLE